MRNVFYSVGTWTRTKNSDSNQVVEYSSQSPYIPLDSEGVDRKTGCASPGS